LVQDDYFCIIGPDEQLFSDHLPSLLRTLQDNEKAGSAWADMLLLHMDNGTDHADLNDPPTPTHFSSNKPIGNARFLFRKSALPPGLETVLPYLDALPMNLLFAVTNSFPARRCTVVYDIQGGCHMQIAQGANPAGECEVLTDYAPSVFGKKEIPADHERPIALSLESMTPEQKTKLAVELAHSVPFPAFLKRIGFWLYRFWLRKSVAGV
jgi:hypothetical protein